MGKYKKIILIVCVISLLLVTVCIIPVSAATVYRLNINQPVADEYSGYIELLVRKSDGTILPVVSFWRFDKIAITGDDLASDVTPSVSVTVSSNKVLLAASYQDIFLPGTGFYYYLDGGSLNGYGSITYWKSKSDGYDNIYRNAWIGASGDTIISYKIYGNGSRHDSSISAGTLNWNISYSESSVLYDSILSFANSLQAGNSAIIENATENADKIQENQDKNTDKIIQNQEENTDKILNGGSDEPPYSAPDTSDVDQMHETEDYIIEQTSAGRENAVSIFNSVGNVFNDTSFSNGMLFVSSFFNEFFGIPWLNSIGSISLALGAFAFVIGSVVVVGRSVTKNAKRAERSERKKGG